MNLLFIGDVIGRPGRRVLFRHLGDLCSRLVVDLVVINGENVAGGFGITAKVAEELFNNGVDVITSGNHVWDKMEALEYITREPRLLRPHNYPEGTPGSGWYVATTASGQRVGILNIMGTVFMQPNLACPFQCADEALNHKPEKLRMVIVDFHAEATSEKMAFGWHLDGRVSAVVGTHTHVPTADERLLHRGTAYISDIGMTGCYDSVIGMSKEQSLNRFLKKLPDRFEVAKGKSRLCAVLIKIDEVSGRSESIERIQLDE